MACCNFTHIKRNGAEGNSYPLTKDTILILGRDEDCDFRVQTSGVSGKHAKLRVDNSGKTYISSLVSNAPVFINDSEVKREILVRDKAVLKIGTCNFKFVYSEGIFSPLREENGVSNEAKSALKTPNSTKKLNKENSSSTKPSRKPPTPIPAKSISSTPKVPSLARIMKQEHASSSSRTPTPYKGTPKSRIEGGASTKKTPTNIPKTATTTKSASTEGISLTPIPTNNSSKRQRSRTSSLLSIPELDESLASPMKPDTPITETSMSQSLTRRSLRARKSSLMSIPEVDQSISSPKSLKRPLVATTPREGEPLSKRSRKSVTFGPVLSPEVFDKRLPPSTPVKAGLTPKGERRSLPASVCETVAEEPEPQSDYDSDSYEYSMTGFEESFSSTDSEESESESEVESTPVKSPKVKRALPTPLRMSIRNHPGLRRRALPTPLKKSIASGHKLRKTKQSMPTPIRKAIEGNPSLRKTKKSMPTPVRKAIQEKPVLRKTKKSMPTPLRAEIEQKPSLRKTKQSMPTPVRQAIEAKPALRKTKPIMPTPVRKDIVKGVTLRKTKRSMPTPLRKQIEEKVLLRKTRKIMPTPLRSQIKNPPKLNKTKKSMPTPLRKAIEEKPGLRKTKKSMPTPLREEIEARPALRKTKQSIPTPIRKEIESKPSLRKTKQSLPTPLKDAIKSRSALRKTKQSLPTPLKDAIKSKPVLRKTKQSLPTPLKEAIKNKPALTKTKQSLPAPVRAEIENGVSLKKTKKALPSPLQKEIKAKHILRHVTVNKIGKRSRPESDSPLPQPPAKRQRIVDVAFNSPSPYDFSKFFKPGAKSPDVEGIQRLFKTPKNKNSADPVDNFSKTIFNSPHCVTFSSPLAVSAKKSSKSQAQAPCLKKTAQPVVFTAEAGSPVATRSRRVARTTTVQTKSTRQAKVVVQDDGKVPVRKSQRGKKTAEIVAEKPAPGATKRTTRSKAKVEPSIESIPESKPIRSTRGRKANTEAVAETEPVVTTRTRGKKPAPAPESRTTRSTRSNTLLAVECTPIVRAKRPAEDIEEAKPKTKRARVKKESSAKAVETKPESKRTKASQKSSAEVAAPVRRSARLRK